MDNFARLLAFGPHAGADVRIRTLLYVDMARIDGSRQEIRAPFAGFHIEPLNQIGGHIGAPRIFGVVELNIVRARIGDRHIPLRDMAALGVIHRVTICMESREPKAVLRVDMSSPRAAHAWRKIDISRLPRLGVRAPDLPLVGIVVEAVDIVVEVGDHSVSCNVALSGRRQDFLEFFGGEVELILFVGLGELVGGFGIVCEF
jgi:hypothetical protein